SNVYDQASGSLRAASSNGGPARRSLGEGGRSAPPTRFLLLRDGGVYFDGPPDKLLAAGDDYVKRFLA
ncbi:MAG: hypothetical protein ACRD4U_04380, partial [Candidatus Acidiferrales bacterium]